MWKPHNRLGDYHVDDTAILWRYIDFYKFADMLETQTLYFRNVTQMVDKWEGFLCTKTVRQIRENLKKAMKADVYYTKADWKQLFSLSLSSDLTFRQNFFVNCWHQNITQSAAMWALYLPNNQEGVAIKTTYAKLKEGLKDAPEDVYSGKVQYIDHEVDEFPFGNVLHPIFHKRLHFTHENEVRLLCPQYPETPEAVRPDFIRLMVDLDTLIDEIWLPPQCDSSLMDRVKEALERQKLAHKPVNKSKLYDPPDEYKAIIDEIDQLDF